MNDLYLTLTKMNEDAVNELMALLPGEEINITKEPEAGLVMMTVKDSFNTKFCLGEVLVTRTEVDYRGIRGYAIVIGYEPNRCIAAASVDAILKSKSDTNREKLLEFIKLQKERIEEAEKLDRRLIAMTKVNFETMERRQ